MVASNELVKVFNGTTVTAREADRYVDATSLCKAAGKKWNNYWRNETTKAFIRTLAESTRIRVEDLVELKSGREGGTWIHPRVVIHFAQWVSPEFAVLVTGWVFDLLTTGKVELKPADSESGSLMELVHILTDQQQLLMDQQRQLAALSRRVEAMDGPSASIAGRIAAVRGYTVADRLEDRYPDWRHTPEQRAAIRAKTNNLIRILHPGQIIEKFNRDCIYDGNQLTLLDRVIDREYRLASRGGRVTNYGLFAADEAV